MHSFTLCQGIYHEKNLPTFCNEKKTHPWLFGAHENPRWPCCYPGAPCQRACQTCRLIPLQDFQLHIVYCEKTDLSMFYVLRPSWMNSSRFFLFKMKNPTPDLGWLPARRFYPVQWDEIVSKELSARSSDITVLKSASWIWLWWSDLFMHTEEASKSRVWTCC